MQGLGFAVVRWGGHNLVSADFQIPSMTFISEQAMNLTCQSWDSIQRREKDSL